MSKDLFISNRKKYFQKANLKDNSVSIFFSGKAEYSTADQKHKFIVNRNFYYLTGIDSENVILVMIRSTRGNKTILFIEEPNETKILWEGEMLTQEVACELGGFERSDINFISKFDIFVSSLFIDGRNNLIDNLEYVYLDLERRNFNDRESFVEEYASKLGRKYPQISIKDSHKILSDLRMYKSEEEIDSIRKAIELTDIGLRNILDNIKECDYEYQVEAHFDFAIKYHGNADNSFRTIAASGKNAATLHYEDNNCEVNKKDLILFDLGVNSNNYASDISRCYPLSGKFSDRQKEVYNACLEVNKKCIEYVKPGITWEQLNGYANDLIGKALIDLGLIEKKEDFRKYYQHTIGHFLGLDVHDVGHYKEPLREGMVLTIEPGIYIKEESIGIRIEDNVLVTKDGYENLSAKIPKEIDEIELIINKK